MSKNENIDLSKIDTINVGIVGHIDHGKTTLLQKLSGKWADTHSDELKRGITIKLGYSDAIIRKDGENYTTNSEANGKPLRYVTFVDAPGHEMLMATMLSGAAIMDAAILVVSADEGIKPQTAEHLIALKAKKIKNIIIVQNKIDLVSKEQAMKNYGIIKEFIKGSVAENAPIIPVSAQQGVNVEYIIEQLINSDIKRESPNQKSVFFIARSFDVNKPGTGIDKLHGVVLGGALKSGVLKVGDTIEIKPGYSYKKQNQIHYKPLKTRIISMQKGPYKTEETKVGGSLALETELDPSLGKSDSLSGGIVGLEGVLPEITENINIKYNLFEKVLGDEEHEEIKMPTKNELLMLSINTSTTVGQVIKSNKESMELSLKIPVVPLKGTSVGLARNFDGHWRLIGSGEII